MVRKDRRFESGTYITLDGIIENPQDWPSGRHEDEGRGQEIQSELLLRCDALLLGRRTYEGFEPVWTAMSGDPFSDHINAMEKWVVTANDLLFRSERAASFELSDATALTSGNVVLTYRVA
jgi:hypothetical protein